MMVCVDPTAGWIETPDGWGRFYDYDNLVGYVWVVMGQVHTYLACYPADECYIGGKVVKLNDKFIHQNC